ncbi:PAQR family membrane homeostasis protein TrhA [Defluviitalea phaphyphila]|uniref:PAQR family membrane homeostasis protein TrhA n=1 Tax=Defluviitalea phaphyphila TaxID=1473580 RepID=UPI000730DDAF|nr:hemolysin III family protein [Defluviitalea phaphyphila]
MLKKIKEPVNVLTHLIGDILSIIGLGFLLYYSMSKGTTWHIVSFSIFGISLILLYTASTLYHALNLSKRKTEILQKIDHMMIYVLIAGTYTPVCLVALRGILGWSLFIFIWIIALIGIFLKIFWFNAPRWLSTLSYIIMGWIVIVAFVPLVKAVNYRGLVYLILGGIFYTIGGIIYGTKRPKINLKFFGFHEIFHIFVLGGSICHFCFMLNLL